MDDNRQQNQNQGFDQDQGENQIRRDDQNRQDQQQGGFDANNRNEDDDLLDNERNEGLSQGNTDRDQSSDRSGINR